MNFRDYTEDEKLALEQTMAQAHPTIVKLCDKKFRTVGDIRKEYLSGKLILNDIKEKQALDSIRNVETDIMGCFGKLVVQIAKRFFLKEKVNKPEVEIDDYIQEGMIALINSAYYYDGSQRFSTFVFCSVQNKLREYIRTNCALSKVKKRISRLRSALHKLMNDKSLTFDAAAEELRLSKKDKQEVMQSLIKAVNDVKWDFAVSDVNFSSTDESANKELARKAFEEAELSDFEREVLDAKIHEVPIARVTEKYHYSRMAGVHALQRAYKLVKIKYDELSKAA